jgi:hypothetical protein
MFLSGLLILLLVIPSFLFLGVIFPLVQGLFVGLWMLCLLFDIHSTYQFYREAPNQFQNNERNKLFGYLTKRFGFKKAALLFPLTIELPLLLFFAVLPLQILYTYMFPHTPTNPMVCIATSFGIAAIGHLQAAVKNTFHNHRHHLHHHKLKTVKLNKRYPNDPVYPTG